jgi:hypothetical protein
MGFCPPHLLLVNQAQVEPFDRVLMTETAEKAASFAFLCTLC